MILANSLIIVLGLINFIAAQSSTSIIIRGLTRPPYGFEYPSWSVVAADGTATSLKMVTLWSGDTFTTAFVVGGPRTYAWTSIIINGFGGTVFATSTCSFPPGGYSCAYTVSDTDTGQRSTTSTGNVDLQTAASLTLTIISGLEKLSGGDDISAPPTLTTSKDASPQTPTTTTRGPTTNVSNAGAAVTKIVQVVAIMAPIGAAMIAI